jgi:hypothetical protein
MSGFRSSTRAVNETLRPLRWILLLPVILVGSLLYWSVALGLGGMSLLAASALSTGATGATLVAGPTEASETGVEAAAPTIEITDGTASPIMVHLEESAEPEDVNDNTGAAPAAPAADENATSRVGPGSTSY